MSVLIIIQPQKGRTSSIPSLAHSLLERIEQLGPIGQCAVQQKANLTIVSGLWLPNVIAEARQAAVDGYETDRVELFDKYIRFRPLLDH
jgi:hypothetical protein